MASWRTPLQFGARRQKRRDWHEVLLNAALNSEVSALFNRRSASTLLAIDRLHDAGRKTTIKWDRRESSEYALHALGGSLARYVRPLTDLPSLTISTRYKSPYPRDSPPSMKALSPAQVTGIGAKAASRDNDCRLPK